MRADQLLCPGVLFEGRFRIEGALGRGGMGEVWAAIDTRLERPVAIKIIHRELAADAHYAARFLREVKLVARVAHPGIVRLYDAGAAADGRLFMIMERAFGATLWRHMAGGARLDPLLALHYAIQIADALATAHAAALVHRDVKPENVVISDRVHARLLDFGVAKDVRALALTKQGVVVGTFRYIAPEQMAGAADGRADLYALGIVLYEMLAGVHPYPGLDGRAVSVTEMQAAHVHLAPRPLPDMLPGCPETLWRAVAMCLAKHPAHRFARAEDLAEALRAVAQVAAPPAHPIARQILRDATDAARARALYAAGAPLPPGPDPLATPEPPPAGFVPRSPPSPSADERAKFAMAKQFKWTPAGLVFDEPAVAAPIAPCFGDRVSLATQLGSLPGPLLERLQARGFDAARLLRWARSAGSDRDARNRLPGTVEPPAPGDVAGAPAEGSPEHARCREIGLAALARGQVALCVLAGGMATRMGGVVKALVEALPGRTFLDLRLAEIDHLERSAGAPVPLWLMTSETTNGPIREALGPRLRTDGDRCVTFEQDVSLRLTPEGELFLDERGEPSVYATGHGDLPDALRRSGILGRFLARGGGTVWIANLDNLGATVDPAILGWHLAHRGPLTVEVVDKVGADRGGGPVRWDGRPIIVEELRLPLGFDPATVPVFNTNTFLADAAALDALAMEWTYVEVEKKVGERRAVQFERLLGELTVGLPTRFLRVPREGVASRFLPVKDAGELGRRRPEIEAIARARGILP